MQKRSDALLSELKAKHKAIDETHTAALLVRVRELFDYSVFVAAPKTMGITTPDETGEWVDNELPGMLLSFLEFEAWTENGAQPEARQIFRRPLLPDSTMEGD